MTISNGIIIGDTVLPGTERVVRDSSAWWAEPSTDIYPRKGYRVDRIVGHWTGGNAHVGPSAGPKLFRAMSGRKRPDGEPMDVSVHFGISWDGLVWQLADLSSATIHVSRKLNIRSIGVECMWPGTATQAERLGMPPAAPVLGHARGQRIACYPPSDELLEAWRWLAGALTTAQHPLLAVPRQRGGESRPGIMEHADSATGTKVDAGGILLKALGLP